MEFFKWLVRNWFDLLQTVAVVGSLLATTHTIREDTRARKVQNALALTAGHRELWSMLQKNPRLRRVLNPKASVERNPPTLDEQLFVQMLILHLRTSLKAREVGLEFGDEDIAADIHKVFSLPIPHHVWEKSKRLQDVALAKLIDEAIVRGNQ